MEETVLTPKLEEKPSNHQAIISVSVALLETILPAGSKILGVKENPERKTFDFTVTHESFPEVKEGEVPQPKQLLLYKEQHLGRTEYK
jgi:hypothetical protein